MGERGAATGPAGRCRARADYDDAVNLYTQVAAATATELGARAQLNIGQCRLAQKRYPEATTALLVVPFTYDYPNLSALALMEAARGFAENKQADQACKLLERVIRDHPDTRAGRGGEEAVGGAEKGMMTRWRAGGVSPLILPAIRDSDAAIRGLTPPARRIRDEGEFP